MENATYIGLSRQLGLRREMDVVAHNIANANTPGYRAERMVFREFLAEPAAGEEVSFVQDVGLARDLSEGPLTATGNTFDVALNGAGYFSIESPLGERYTRHGRFQLDANGQLVTQTGDPVLGANGPIAVPTDGGPVTIASDGTMSNDNGIFGKLRVVTFEDEQRLQKSANSLYSTPQDMPPQPVATPGMTQGMLEGSNVRAILEMTRMIGVQRTHDSVARFLQQEDERQKKMVEILGQPPGA